MFTSMSNLLNSIEAVTGLFYAIRSSCDFSRYGRRHNLNASSISSNEVTSLSSTPSFAHADLNAVRSLSKHGCIWRRRLDDRRRGGRPPARSRSRPVRGRGHRDGLERPALERLLAGPARAALRGRRRLVPRPVRRRARPHLGRGAPRADHGLRQGLPRPGPQHGHPTRCRT